MPMSSWHINVTYGVTAKKNKKKYFKIEDKPLMLFVTLRMKIHFFFYLYVKVFFKKISMSQHRTQSNFICQLPYIYIYIYIYITFCDSCIWVPSSSSVWKDGPQNHTIIVGKGSNTHKCWKTKEFVGAEGFLWRIADSLSVQDNQGTHEQLALNKKNSCGSFR